MVCDSNILIYAAEPGDTLCLPMVQRPDALISSVTRVEVLGFPALAHCPKSGKIVWKISSRGL